MTFRVRASNRAHKNYRDKLDIIECILKRVSNGCRKTHIMYGANLSTVQLKKYLDMLVRIGCLAYDEDLRLFKLTHKGNDLLTAIDDVAHAKAELRISQKKLEHFMNDDSECIYNSKESNLKKFSIGSTEYSDEVLQSIV